MDKHDRKHNQNHKHEHEHEHEHGHDRKHEHEDPAARQHAGEHHYPGQPIDKEEAADKAGPRTVEKDEHKGKHRHK